MSKLLEKKYFYVTAVIIITLLFMSPNLLNGFLNWDDSAYVLQNELIKDLSFKGIKEIFTTPEVVSTYAPLVLISWAIDYALAGLNPTMFHLTNLLLHVLIVGLIFYLAKQLTKNNIAALIVAVLFGIHPMHVEVVGWVSARKDLLYTFFFVLSLIVYYFYVYKETKYPKSYYYILCLVFYILSLLSKGTAVVLPLILLLFDYLKERRLTYKLIVEKIPFILLSIFFVVLSVKMQAKGGAMGDRQYIGLLDSLSVGFYGYITYLIKVIVPFNLSAYHPYPNQLGEANPWYFYASAIPVLMVFVWLMTQFKRRRKIVFGFGFFFIGLIPVIQVLPFGSAVTADRYTYLPYFGVFYLISLAVIYLYEKFKVYQKIIGFGVCVYILILGCTTYKYSNTFRSGEALWSNVIKYYPNDFLAYMNRAEYRISKKNYIPAINDLDRAIEINPGYHPLYYNRAFANAALEKDNLALKDLSKAIEIDKEYVVAYLNRGIVYGKQQEYYKAIRDFSKVIYFKPKEYYGYYNRAVYYRKINQFVKAIADLTSVIELGQFLDEAHFLRGKNYLALNDVNNAFKDFEKTLEINPSYAAAHTLRGNLWLDKTVFEEALKDYNKAILLEPNLEIDAYINRGIIYMNKKKYNEAGLDFERAKQLSPNNYLAYYNMGLLYQLGEKHKKAIKEFDKTLSLKPNFFAAKMAKDRSSKFLTLE